MILFNMLIDFHVLMQYDSSQWQYQNERKDYKYEKGDE